MGPSPTASISVYQQLKKDCQGVKVNIEDNRNFGSFTSTLDECKAACDGHSDCTGFNFVVGEGCWLKNGCDGEPNTGVGYKKLATTTTTTTTACTDNHPMCPTWAEAGHCTSPTLRHGCRVSCNNCEAAS